MTAIHPRIAIILHLLGLLAVNGAHAAKIEYNRDVRPILSENCFKSHGFDANTRKAKMRLDLREEALKPARSDAVPIVPGKPDESEMIRRVTSTDEDDIESLPAALRRCEWRSTCA